jgi:hypothetical protein
VYQISVFRDFWRSSAETPSWRESNTTPSENKRINFGACPGLYKIPSAMKADMAATRKRVTWKTRTAMHLSGGNCVEDKVKQSNLSRMTED